MILAKIILFAPLLGAVFTGLQTQTISARAAQIVTTGLLFVAAIASLYMFYDVALLQHPQHVTLVKWIYSGEFQANWSILIDPLTAVMLVVVTGVSSLVHLYSIGYMDEDPFKQRFMAYLSLFTFFMLVLVTADNFIQMFVGWEGVGLCSYLLIGFWFHKDSANAAAIKAFVVNRIGDFGFILGIAGVFMLFGSVNFHDVFSAAAAQNKIYWNILGFDVHAITLICILLFIGACGKSAQFGLHTWLPDAMEGPTPVSALIHAATMVTAGVFMIARCSPLFELSITAREVVVVVGAFTAIFAATIALTQNDIKKVIAYSTCSQLGYMVFACGLSAYQAGIFHLATHAFFKALLFLGAGSVIHAMHHEQDIRKMGGLWKKIPLTYALFWIGTLAITGIPFLAGYYSKEAILGMAYNGHTEVAEFAFWMGAITALMTSFYSFRLLFLTFHGKTRADHHTFDHAHESPPTMLIPLIILSIGAIFSGWYGEEILHVLSPNAGFWYGSLPANEALNHIHPPEWIVPGAVIMGVIAAIIYIWKLSIASKLAQILRPLYLASLNKWYIDEIYNVVFIRPTMKIASFFWREIDVKIVDGMPNGAAGISQRFGSILKRFQTGFIYQYSLVMILALTILISIFIFKK